MTLRMLVAATVAALPMFAIEAAARAPEPMLPTALVEDVKSTGAGVEFMDYVGRGQVIKLGPGDTLVLSYLRSCEHETITGGTVVVGMERSEVSDGKVVRAKVPCDVGTMQMSPQVASQSAASAFRVQSAEGEVQPKLYARAPVIQLPKGLTDQDRTLLIVRTDRKGERHTLKIDDATAAAGFYDLAKSKVSLTRGAIYDVTVGGHTTKFKIAANAKSGPTPVVSRLVRVQ